MSGLWLPVSYLALRVVVGAPLDTITIDEARGHWRDQESPCNQLQAYRDLVWRWRDWMSQAPDRGRRWRNRMLARAEHDMVWARRACPMCRAFVAWPSGNVTPGRGWVE